MHKLMVVYQAQKDPAHFKQYYEGTHLKLAAKLPGMRRSSYSFDIKPMGPGPAPFCVFEAWFDNEAAMTAALESPEGQAVSADVPNYVTGDVALFHYDVAA